MNIDYVKKIIKEEKLVNYNLLETRNDAENEIVLKRHSEIWYVYATDERASKVTGSERMFCDEEEALENFLKRLRAMNVLIKKYSIL